ncbi:AAWKG family protein [Streptomyces sp. NPDC020996]|uniref:AAWKG family protein n=1 Tax=Streptomyces sp. NPDC020996 TaxID=3154791 RepID=UPI0034010452
MAEDTSNDDDYWARAVALFTGYTMPDRNTLFEKLKSKEGVPLFRHGIETLPVRELQPGDIGRNVRGGEDYDIVFYTSSGGDGAHEGVKMKRVRIVLIGVLTDAKGRATFFHENNDDLGNAWRDNNAFTGIDGSEWDASAMAQYVFGGRQALGALLTQSSTKDFSFAGQRVPDSGAVDLRSFERTAQSFDRAKKFFVDQAEVLDQWEKALGSEQSAWRGKAAGVFRGLIKQLHSNYAGYAEQLGGKDYAAKNFTVDYYFPTSTVGDQLAAAQRDLQKQVDVLIGAWKKWAATGVHDPHYVVKELLDDLATWLSQHNHTKVLKRKQNSGYPGADFTTYETKADFLQSHPVYGDLNKDEAWKRLGEAAAKKWREQVDAYLEQSARNAVSGLGNSWQTVASAVKAPRTKGGTSTLADMYQKDEEQLSKEEAEKQKKEAEKQGDSLNKAMEELNKFGENMNKGLGDFTGDLNKGLENFGKDMSKGMENFGKDVTEGLNETAKGIGENVSGLNDNLKDFGDGLTDNLRDLNGAGGTDQGTSPFAPSTLPVTSPLNDLPSDGSLFDPGNGTTDGKSADSISNPDGSTTKLNPDGSLTTTYPDGTVSVLNPSTGTLTTTSPDGKSTTTPVDRGKAVTNPDGSTTTLNPDGSLTTKYPDGTVQTIKPDGTVTTVNPDGTVDSTQLNPAQDTVTGPDGSTTKLNPDGTLTRTFPDGSKEIVDPSKGTVTTTTPDGTTHTDPLGSGTPVTNPDGSTTVLNPDGSLTTKYPDGTVQTIEPDGTVTTTKPDGTVTTSDLNGTPAGSDGSGDSGKTDTAGGSGTGSDTSGLNDDLPEWSPSSLDDLGYGLPDLSGGGFSTTPLNQDLAGLGGTGDTAGGGAGADSWEEYDSTPYSGGSLGGPTSEPAEATGGSTADQQSSGGVPLNPMAFGGMGGMGAMGMGGMGGAGGTGGSNGERVRSVLSDGDGAALRRRPRSRAASADDEEDVIVTRGGRPVTTSTPYVPMGMPGGQGGRATESGDRVRSNWETEEDDDVWGTDEGGAPAVIGR